MSNPVRVGVVRQSESMGLERDAASFRGILEARHHLINISQIGAHAKVMASSLKNAVVLACQ
jgi:hypothetical protein